MVMGTVTAVPYSGWYGCTRSVGCGAALRDMLRVRDPRRAVCTWEATTVCTVLIRVFHTFPTWHTGPSTWPAGRCTEEDR
eukprot:SAG22_NODE_13198_length_415_cov_0.651899_1_plen_79_part_10